ncbi:MAG: inverse autotransporter beta domain-containing protein [Anaerolineae bacterium]
MFLKKRPFEFFAILSFSFFYLLMQKPLAAISLSSSMPEGSKWQLDFIQEVSHTEGNGVGFDIGYTKGSLFLIGANGSQTFSPFIDFKGSVLNNGNYNLALGIGSRSLISSICGYLGANLYYDYLCRNQGYFQQVGGGFEFFGDGWEFRINGYFPVGNKKQIVSSCLFDDYVGGFFMKRTRLVNAMTGGDAEVGGSFEMQDFSFYAGLAGYYYNDTSCKCRSRQTGGAALRLDVGFSQYVKVELKGSADPLFGVRGQGTLFLTFPLSFGNKKRAAGRCNAANKKRLKPVYRNDFIVTRKNCFWEWNF